MAVTEDECRAVTGALCVELLTNFNRDVCDGTCEGLTRGSISRVNRINYVDDGDKLQDLSCPCWGTYTTALAGSSCKGSD